MRALRFRLRKTVAEHAVDATAPRRIGQHVHRRRVSGEFRLHILGARDILGAGLLQYFEHRLVKNKMSRIAIRCDQLIQIRRGIMQIFNALAISVVVDRLPQFMQARELGVIELQRLRGADRRFDQIVAKRGHHRP